MQLIKKYINTYKHKLILLRSTLNYMDLQYRRYTPKCHFKPNILYLILYLKLEKNNIIKVCKVIKRIEGFIKNDIYEEINGTISIRKKLERKRKVLNKILDETKTSLKDKGYGSKQLEKQIKKVYEQYKHKSHFIIENDKYNDLEKIIKKIKNVQTSLKEEENIRNNIFNILLEQLRHKVNIDILIPIPILRDYLNKQSKLTHNTIFNNYYYYELLKTMENGKTIYLGTEKLKRISI
ncbi:hypothetical protein bcCo53_001339 (plasmid) [Borrelia coriaceae]|uniref:Uncharacterized protein n=1 Tax=Borrelia coriaceae ATCC 43381 TaxID=1408429 RepID=W5T2I3_9SPIR|nr:plasmid maintenance protein [Borrelia coriaceae]AHH11536.1 Hypothetical protein BCO_0129705 [Borrelia coriaceae ATCC 43381]UPA17164.1 hypothetical protein bcCo53_001339 [Borrelia coriaceae]